jgi:protein-tyrosine phosphatase
MHAVADAHMGESRTLSWLVWHAASLADAERPGIRARRRVGIGKLRIGLEAPNSVTSHATTGTVDLHCHLLPGIDDGARDLADSVEMAQQAAADGIAAICATPHIRADHAVHIEELPARQTELRAALRQAGCRTRVLPGGEVATDMLDTVDDRELGFVTLGGSGRWILLEPAPGPLDERASAAVDGLRARGFRALLAHPERHPAPDLVDRLRRLIARGALVQATAACFTEGSTRAAMLTLVRAGVLHVLGSDAHSARAGRRVELAAALGILAAAEPDAGHLEWVAYTAPWGIVRGQDVVSPFPSADA